MMQRTACATAFWIVMVTASGVSAGECQVVAAAGNGPTESIATIMSTHGLENIIEAKGLKAQGSVVTKCTPGTLLTECRSQQKACK